jgi:hypothetical protein
MNVYEIDFTQYLAAPRPQKLASLTAVMQNIAVLTREIGDLEADYIRAKAGSLAASDQGSASARNQRAFVDTAMMDATLIGLRAQKEALQEEKWFLIRLLDGGSD